MRYGTLVLAGKGKLVVTRGRPAVIMRDHVYWVVRCTWQSHASLRIKAGKAGCPKRKLPQGVFLGFFFENIEKCQAQREKKGQKVPGLSKDEAK